MIAKAIGNKRTDRERKAIEAEKLLRQVAHSVVAGETLSEKQLLFVEEVLEDLRLTDELKGIVKRSRAKVAEEQAEKERIRKREIQDANRIRKNLRLALGAAVVAVVLAIGAGYFFLDARDKEKPANESATKAIEKEAIALRAKAEAEKALRSFYLEKINQNLTKSKNFMSLQRSALAKNSLQLVISYNDSLVAKGGESTKQKAEAVKLLEQIKAP